MRRQDREITDRGEIRAIVERAKILHLGLNDEGRPYVVPLHYGVEWAEELPVFYVHGAKEGRKLDLLRRDGRVFVEIDAAGALVPGGETPCRYGAVSARCSRASCATPRPSFSPRAGKSSARCRS